MTAAQRFRKKPVEIEAMQCLGGDLELVADWCGGQTRYVSRGEDEPYWGVDITTLEGVMTARIRDWVIRGVQGEFYPCKPDIFAATYEPATSTPGVKRFDSIEEMRADAEAADVDLDGGPR